MTKDGHPLIADFGFATKIGERVDPRGSLGYIAPEIFKAANLNEKYTTNTATDIWSFGCLMADLLEGDSLYNWQRECLIINNAELELAKSAFFSSRKDPNNSEYFIDKCLQIDPAKRSTAAEVAKGLKKIYEQL